MKRSICVAAALLASALVMDRTTLVRVLKPLIRDGLVVAPIEERLKRRLRLMLTEKGHERFERAAAHWRAVVA